MIFLIVSLLVVLTVSYEECPYGFGLCPDGLTCTPMNQDKMNETSKADDMGYLMQQAMMEIMEEYQAQFQVFEALGEDPDPEVLASLLPDKLYKQMSHMMNMTKVLMRLMNDTVARSQVNMTAFMEEMMVEMGIFQIMAQAWMMGEPGDYGTGGLCLCKWSNFMRVMIQYGGGPGDGGGDPNSPDCGTNQNPVCYCSMDPNAAYGYPTCPPCGGEMEPDCAQFTTKLPCGGLGEDPCFSCGGEMEPKCYQRCGGMGDPACCGDASQPPCPSRRNMNMENVTEGDGDKHEPFCPCSRSDPGVFAKFMDDIDKQILNGYTLNGTLMASPCSCTTIESIRAMTNKFREVVQMTGCQCDWGDANIQWSCPCPPDQYWCHERGECVFHDSPCMLQEGEYKRCLMNEFECWIGEHVMCASSEFECGCYWDGYPYTCNANNRTYCATTLEECGTKEYLVQCKESEIECPDGNCVMDWMDCECKRMVSPEGERHKWCPMFGHCIRESEKCEHNCNSEESGYFFCQMESTGWSFCTWGPMDCDCKNRFNNPESFWCERKGICVSMWEECEEHKDECAEWGMIRCKNQSLSSGEYRGDGFNKDQVKNDPLFLALTEGVTCSCLLDNFLNALEVFFTMMEGMGGDPYGDNYEDTYGKTARRRLKDYPYVEMRRMVNGDGYYNETNECVCDNGPTSNSTEFMMLMMYVKDIMNLKFNATVTNCECQTRAMVDEFFEVIRLNLDNITKNNQEQYCGCDPYSGYGDYRDDGPNYNYDPYHPPVVCGMSDTVCDACTNQNLLPCPDGSCVDNYDACFEVELTCMDFGFEVECPHEGTEQFCGNELADCYKKVEDCGIYGWVNCPADPYRCYPFFDLCPADMCMSRGMIACPGTNPKFPECREDLRQCNKTCDFKAPFLCLDGTCKQYDWECGMGSCPEGQVRCKDRECIDPASQKCCDPNTQFRCFINDQCIKHEEGYKCDPSFKCKMDEFPCPNIDKCVKEPKYCVLPDCATGEIRCKDGSCRPMIGNETDCTCKGRVGELWCPEENVCRQIKDIAECYPCPSRFYRCPTTSTNPGKCVEQKWLCDTSGTPNCPPDEGLCTSYRCVRDYFACNMDHCPHICQNNGMCVDNIAHCCEPGTLMCFVGDMNGQCVDEWNYYDICTDDSFVMCDWHQHMCHDGTCVDDPFDCPCPMEGGVQLEKCADGDCVFDKAHCIKDNAYFLCPDGVMCDDGTCKRMESSCGTMPNCPRGFKRCPNGIDCIPSYQSVDDRCPPIVQCPYNNPIFCKVSKECVDHIGKCPGAPICGEKEKLCWNFKCTTGNCSVPMQCSADEIRCPIGGECKKTAIQCPRGMQCRMEEKLCPGGMCVYQTDDCPEMMKCDKYLCPMINLCVDDASMCPSVRECPVGYIKCMNGDCQKNLDYCPKDIFKCPEGMLECPGTPGLCEPQLEWCPSMIVCPTKYPFLCWDNECVDDPSNCRDFSACPPSQKRCPNGDCIWDYMECAKEILCPLEYPIKCSDGMCVDKREYCQESACDSTMFRCATGECVSDKFFCPSDFHCDGVLCWDRSCQSKPEDCPTMLGKVCDDPDYPVLCPDQNCYTSKDDCPARVNCPIENPIFCGGICVDKEEKCKDILIECPSKEFLCGDGITCSLNGTCPSQVVCTTAFPFRCLDGTCRSGPHACAAQIECDWGLGEKKCWDSSCVGKDEECPPPIFCAKATPVLCPDFVCVASKANCSTTFGCPNGTVFCSRNKLCVPDAECKLVDDSCPEGFKMCDDGTCKSDLSKCLDAKTGCLTGWIRCDRDGSCVKDSTACNAKTPIVCTGLTIQCNDGTCRSSCGTGNSEVQANGCIKSKPKLCQSTKTCVAENEKCDSSVFCPNGLKKCKGGLCADVNDVCPLQPFELMIACIKSEGDANYPCFDGSCAEEEEECPLVFPCPEEKPYRCPNGNCIEDATFCSGMDAGCPIELPHRCDSGLCAPSSDLCLLTNGCPQKYPIACDNGKCVNDEAYCIDQNDLLPNGCKNKAPVRCDNGACVVTSDKCVKDNGCPGNAPIKCPNGQCKAQMSLCSNSTDCPLTLCPNGQCVFKQSDCLSKSGCPVKNPFRCSNGMCKKYAKLCPPAIRCNDPKKPHLCFSGECAESKSLCRKVQACETGLIRCTDGTCRKENDCRSICPPGNPFKCPMTGECVSSPKYCINPKEIACKKNKQFYCAITDDCVDKPITCFIGLSCDVTEERCWEGSCVTNLEDCPELPACPPAVPVRCLDGSCKQTVAKCGSAAACASGEKRCKDGRCIDTAKTCPPVGGCEPLNYLCPNFKCMSSQELCKEGDNYPCWNGEEYETPQECPKLPKVSPVDVTVSSEKVALTLSDEESAEDLLEVEIPPFSFDSDDNATLAAQESYGSVQILTTGQELLSKAIISGQNKTTVGDRDFTANPCSVGLTINALNVDGTKRSGVKLKKPTKMYLKPNCLKGENATLYIGSIDEVTGEITIESNTSVVYRGNKTYYEGQTSHYSSFSLTKYVSTPAKKTSWQKLKEAVLNLPLWVVGVIVLAAVAAVFALVIVIAVLCCGAGCCVMKVRGQKRTNVVPQPYPPQQQQQYPPQQYPPQQYPPQQYPPQQYPPQQYPPQQQHTGKK